MSTPAGMSEPTAELMALANALGRQAPPCESHPEAWYAPDPSQAIKRCGDYHGRAECLALAVALDERWGVWGGRSFERQPASRRSPSLRQRAAATCPQQTREAS